MSANEPTTITVKLSRETKKTYRYDAVEEDAPVGIYTFKRRHCPASLRHSWSFS